MRNQLLGLFNAPDQKRAEALALMTSCAPVFCILLLGCLLHFRSKASSRGPDSQFPAQSPPIGPVSPTSWKAAQ